MLDLLAEGDLRYNERAYDEALRLYEAAARLEANNLYVMHRLRLAQQREAARQRFLLSVPTEPASRSAFLEELYAQALSLYSDHRLAAARDRFEEVYFVDSGFRRVRHYLDRVERDLAVVEEVQGGAAQNLPPVASGGGLGATESILVTPGFPTHDELMIQGEAFMDASNPERAFETFTRALMTDPNSRTAQRARERAARSLERQQELDLQGQLAAADQMVDANRFDDARAVYASVLAIDSENEAAQEGILELEREQARLAAQERGQLVAMHLQEGEQALARDEFDQAQSAFEGALLLDSTNREAANGLEDINHARERAANQELENALSAALTRARLALDGGDNEQAIAHADQAIRLDPEDRAARRLRETALRAQEAAASAATLSRAQDLLSQGDIDGARRMTVGLSESGSLDRESAASLENLTAAIGNAQAQIDADARAAELERQQRERQVTIDRTLAEARTALNDGQLDEATQAAQAALALDAANAAAQAIMDSAAAEREAALIAQAAAVATQQDQIESLIDEARRLLRADNYEAAISTAQQVFALDVDNSDAQRIIADAQEEQAEAREREAAEAARTQDRQIRSLLREGGRSLRRENYSEAITAAEQVIAIDPQNADARELLSNAQTAQTEAAQAQASEARADEIEGLLDQAKSSLRNDDYAGAISAAQRVLDLDVDNEDAREIVADAQREQMETAEEQAEVARVRRVAELRDQAETRRDAGDLQGALQALQEADSLQPDSGWTHRRIQRSIRRVEADIAEANENSVEEAALAAERQREQQLEDLMAEAEALHEAGQLEAAMSALSQAMDLEPGRRDRRRIEGRMSDIQDEMIEAREEAMRRAEAAESAETARAAAEQAAQVEQLIEQAAAQREAGDLDASQATLGRAAEMDPENSRVQRDMRRIENMRAEMAREAEEAEEARVRQARDTAELHIRDGNRALRRDRHSEAADHFRMALDAMPGNAEAVAGLAAAEEALMANDASITPDAADPREQSRELHREALALRDAGRNDEAAQRLREAITIWPENSEARQALRGMDAAGDQMPRETAARDAAETDALVQGLLAEGSEAYNQGDVITAVERWERALQLKPANDYARTYLAETRAEYEGALAQQAAEASMMARESQLRTTLDTPISITTPPEGTPLQVFLNNISVFTDLNFLIADGVNVSVTGSFIDKPLSEVLNAVITSNGLRWTVEETIITIRPNFFTRVFQLNPDDTAALAVFRDSGSLDRTLYPPDGEVRVSGQSYELDDITGTFLITGSQDQIEKVNDLIATLPGVSTTPMVTRIYQVRADEAPRFRTLVEAVLDTERTPQTMAFERRIFLEDDVLIVRATEREQERITQLLAEYDPEGLGLTERGLEVATYSLIPRRVLQQSEEVARDLAEQIRETVEVLLYAKEGADAARAQGRRMWFDEFTLQLTITDTPDNISRITRYVQSIPQLEQARITKIINVDHQVASTLAGKLEDFLGIEIRGAESADSGQASGNVATFRLRAEDERTFRDLRITLIEVEENDINDDRDEDVTMIIDTLTTSEERTIEELRSEIIDDYRIRIVDADAGSGPNSGRAEIEVTFLGPGRGGTGGGQVFQAIPATAGAGQQQGAGGQQQGAADTVEDDTVPVVQADDDTNSLLVSVVSAGDLDLIEQAIELLDVPILQASIETKFVEVNENRAREIQSELAFLNLTEGVSFTDSFLTARYAQDQDEFHSLWEPALESPLNASLPKGRTVLSLITGGSSPLQWELAFLEAEGVVSTVNGPHIVTQNNNAADFEITQEFQAFQQVVRVLGQTLPNTITNQPPDVFGLAPIELVQMDVTPTITASGYITLDVDVEISNFTNNLGQLFGPQSVQSPFGNSLFADSAEGAATGTLPGMFSNNRKELQTIARVKDGGTIVLGGWTLERVTQTSSGVPILRNLPYVGQIFFSRNQDLLERLTLLIFLTANIVDVD
jgi:type II secretory pathway component GspD/PulD (secretin)